MSLLYQIALTKINGVGPVIARQLLNYFPDPEGIFRATKKELLTIPGIGNRLAEAVLDKQALHAAENEIRFIEKHRINAFFRNDAGYPKRLEECPDAPILLYYKGNADLNANRMVSIVGTRNATEYGKSICSALIRDLQPYGVTVISGLAYGIDSYAHRNALEYSVPTIGVLGHGLDRIYPSANRALAAHMLEEGGLITEFTSGTNPDKQNFPMRNRIIAGLSDVTIVVEAALKGGALITAEIANTYFRDVCAFPGNLDREFSSGCNYLIKTHRAHLITCADDLAYLMNWVAMKSPPQKALPVVVNLTSEEQQAYDLIQGAGQATVDELARHLQWPQSKLAITLLEMEIKGVVTALPGKVYRTL